MDPVQPDQLVVALRAASQGLDVHRSIYDLETTLGRIVASAVETVPGADAGSISMSHDGVVETSYPTSREIEVLDQVQGELYEGPCITALNDPAATVSCWPGTSPARTPCGGRASRPGPWSPGTGLYSRAPNAFDEQARRIAGLFGVQAALLLYGAHHAAQLSQALEAA
jgi:hypothetical protein